MPPLTERMARRGLIVVAVAGLALGLAASFAGHAPLARWLVNQRIVEHERNDERTVYPRLTEFLADRHGLGAMSRAHREIMHQARLLSRLADGLSVDDADHYLVRDAQRVIESIEALVRIHNAQEEDIYEHAAAA